MQQCARLHFLFFLNIEKNYQIIYTLIGGGMHMEKMRLVEAFVRYSFNPTVVFNNSGQILHTNQFYESLVYSLDRNRQQIKHVNDLPYKSILHNRENKRLEIQNIKYEAKLLEIIIDRRRLFIESLFNTNGTSPQKIEFRLSKEFYSVLNSVQEGVYIIDGKANTLWVNNAFIEKTGIAREEVINKNVKNLGGNLIFDPSIISEVLLEKTPQTILQHAKETGKAWLVKGYPLIDEEENINHIILTIHDVTELPLTRAKLTSTDPYLPKIHSNFEKTEAKTEEAQGLIASSFPMKKTIRTIHRVAVVDATVLLLGESGTGKSAFAKLIHYLSERKSRAFVQINCGAIPENLLESELFGYKNGAFTGASKEGKMGLIESANGGTLFLDEIGELPLSLQVKLLHLLQEKKIRRIGDTKEKEINTRIICATNKNLEKMVKDGEFREDLYYRLTVVPIHIDPLRERQDDIMPLMEHYLASFSSKYKVKKELDLEAKKALVFYSWPGNVRELQNLMEQLVILSDGDVITLEDLPNKIKNEYYQMKLPILPVSTIKDFVSKTERDIIMEVWRQTKNKTEAANILGIHRTTFIRKAKKLGLTLE
jgi:PAS domain S-box-containing protein